MSPLLLSLSPNVQRVQVVRFQRAGSRRTRAYSHCLDVDSGITSRGALASAADVYVEPLRLIAGIKP